MSAEDIDKLCFIFHRVPIEKLRSMDDHLLPRLEPTRRSRPPPTVDSIRRCLNALHDEKERLQCMAKLYAWLIPRGVYGPWALYRFNEVSADIEPVAVREKLVEQFGSFETIGAHDVLDEGITFSWVILTKEFPSTYKPVCFHMWRGLPFLAVHTPGMTYHHATHWPALASVMGRLEGIFYGLLNDLTETNIEAKFFSKI